MSAEQRDVVSTNYQAAASNAQAIGGMLSRLPRSIDYGVTVELSAKANAAVQRFHDAIGCLVLEAEIEKRNRENEEARKLLAETQARLKQKKKQ